MEENVFIIHPSEIIRKGLAWIIQEYFKMEITQLNSCDDLQAFSGISNCLIIIILKKGYTLPVAVEEKLKKNNQLYRITYGTESEDQAGSLLCEYNLNELSTNLHIQKIIQVIRKSATKAKALNNENGDLTQREKDVIRQIALGLANKEIADKLNISIHTVISHRKNITEKLNIKSISGLTVYAIMNSLLDITEINPEELI